MLTCGDRCGGGVLLEPTSAGDVIRGAGGPGGHVPGHGEMTERDSGTPPRPRGLLVMGPLPLGQVGGAGTCRGEAGKAAAGRAEGQG